jgi:hypothetical protein
VGFGRETYQVPSRRCRSWKRELAPLRPAARVWGQIQLSPFGIVKSLHRMALYAVPPPEGYKKNRG